MSMREQVILITGASRGVGRGIALALARPGRVIYLTGRSALAGSGELPGSLAETAAEVEARGGVARPVVCDHGDDVQVEALFAQIKREQGRLDLLVNNVLQVAPEMIEKGPFWSKPLALQGLLDVGLRSTYVASYYAAPLLLANGGGWVINTSSFGGTCYMHGPAYGAGKAGVDKMAHDMAVDFEPHGVHVISLWLGLMSTERSLRVFADKPELYGRASESAQSPEFPGLVIEALLAQPDPQHYSGQVWIAAELAARFGVTDLEGRQPPSLRQRLGEPPRYSPARVE